MDGFVLFTDREKILQILERFEARYDYLRKIYDEAERRFNEELILVGSGIFGPKTKTRAQIRFLEDGWGPQLFNRHQPSTKAGVYVQEMLMDKYAGDEFAKMSRSTSIFNALNKLTSVESSAFYLTPQQAEFISQYGK
jgi:hypothetical protein